MMTCYYSYANSNTIIIDPQVLNSMIRSIKIFLDSSSITSYGQKRSSKRKSRIHK